MKYGVVMRTDIDLREIPKLASECEQAGWDGFFIWDGFMGPNPWLLLSAAAMTTERLALGIFVTAPSRGRPWDLASEAATLDHLSAGRAVLPIGLGAAEDLGFANVGEETDRKVRAEMLDESLDVIYGLWSGLPVTYRGKHYRLNNAKLSLKPVQAPHIPIWVVGAWPRSKSMQRALRCDGLIAAKMTSEGASVELTPEDIQPMREYVTANRRSALPFDIIFEGETPGDDKAAASRMVRPYAEAGVTWWLESIGSAPYKKGGLAGVRARIAQGPPRI